MYKNSTLNVNYYSLGFTPRDYVNNSIYAEIVDRKYLYYKFNGRNFDEIQRNLRSFKILNDEIFLTTFTSFLMFYRGYVNEVFEKFILEAHQHGIIDYCYRKIYRYEIDENQLESEAQVLTMYMLSVGFYIWLGSVIIACIVFILEHAL